MQVMREYTLHLSGAQGDDTKGVGVRALLDLPHKLGQLCVCATAIVDLGEGGG